ncbi:MAG: phenylacetic acid degradation protein [Anaerolineae bacterium]|nr:phenylacetic acid degradation protein [Anaerolineae bacterium]
MSGGDTQWPRFEIFQQARPDGPFDNVGSVHAPDAEMALQNARDVFVRRPQTATLWVVPASAILTVTREELASGTGQPPPGAAADQTEQIYHVFTKSSQRRSMTFVTYHGDVLATSAEHALEKMLLSEDGAHTYVYWVVPDAAITSSRPDDAESMFAPAHRKSFRLPGAYHTRTLMDEVRRANEEPDNASDT